MANIRQSKPTVLYILTCYLFAQRPHFLDEEERADEAVLYEAVTYEAVAYERADEAVSYLLDEEESA